MGIFGKGQQLMAGFFVCFVEQVNDFFQFNILKGFATLVQDFGKMNGCILHPLMRIQGTAQQKEIFAPGNAMISILVVETHPQKTDQLTFFLILFTLLFVGHLAKLPIKVLKSLAAPDPTIQMNIIKGQPQKRCSNQANHKAKPLSIIHFGDNRKILEKK
jgi:hypothetical protein